MSQWTDILLSQKFLPEPGGSIRWMYEVYRRWPTPVRVITHDYYRVPPNTPEFATVPPPANGVDHVTDENLVMDRRDIFINNWGLDRPHRIVRYLRMTRAVHQQLRRNRHVRVHCTHAVPEVVSLLPLRALYGRDRLRIICYAHGEEVTACCSSRQLKMLMHRAHAAVDVMICNSKNTTRLLEGHIDARKLRVVHPGVDLAEYADAEQAGRQWRRDRGVENKLIVFTLGRLDPRKNHAAVVEAVARLAPKFPDLLYVLAGDGREMAGLRARAERLGVSGRIEFAGAVSGGQRLQMYGGCDVFAMPAIRVGTDVEGFGMVFIEAGACGKPCVAGKEGGQSEAVIDGETGFVVDGADVDAVTAALERLLSDASLRRRMGERARMLASELDWPRVVQRTLKLVEEIE